MRTPANSRPERSLSLQLSSFTSLRALIMIFRLEDFSCQVKKQQERILKHSIWRIMTLESVLQDGRWIVSFFLTLEVTLWQGMGDCHLGALGRSAAANPYKLLNYMQNLYLIINLFDAVSLLSKLHSANFFPQKLDVVTHKLCNSSQMCQTQTL